MSSSVREGTTDLQVKSLGPCDPGIAWGSEDGSEVEDQTEWSLNSLVGEEEHRLVFGHEEWKCVILLICPDLTLLLPLF